MLLWKVEGLLLTIKNMTTLDTSGVEISNNCFGTEGSKECKFNFFSFASQRSVNTHLNGQYLCLLICGKNWRHSKQISVLRKEIWDYLLSKEIKITAEYLPGVIKVKTDTQSGPAKDAGKCKLNPRIFQKTCKCRETPEIDLFASRITAITLIRLMKTGPLQLREKCFPNSLDQVKRICPSAILSYKSGIKKRFSWTKQY